MKIRALLFIWQMEVELNARTRLAYESISWKLGSFLNFRLIPRQLHHCHYSIAAHPKIDVGLTLKNFFLNSLPINEIFSKGVDRSETIRQNSHNRTVTLSTRKGNAQPWRFFYGRNSALGALA